MPRNVEEWDRRRNRSVSLSDYHIWVIDKLAGRDSRRDRSQVIAALVESAGKVDYSLSAYLTDKLGTEVKKTSCFDV